MSARERSQAGASVDDYAPSSHVLHCCDDYVVVNKPPDVRMDGEAFPVTVEKLLRAWKAPLFDGPGRGIKWVHQLDHATSGCLCVATNRRAARAAAALFKHRLVRKTYRALLLGHLDVGDVPLDDSATDEALKAAIRAEDAGPGRGGVERVEHFPAVHFFQAHQAELRARKRRGEPLSEADEELLAHSWKTLKELPKRRRVYDRLAEEDRQKKRQKSPDADADAAKTRAAAEAPPPPPPPARVVDASREDVERAVIGRAPGTGAFLACEELGRGVLRRRVRGGAAGARAPRDTAWEQGGGGEGGGAALGDTNENGIFGGADGTEEVVVDLRIAPAAGDFRMRLAGKREGGRRASTVLRVLCRGHVDVAGASVPVTAVSMRLLTGRRHQLRVHALALGHPILGDATYAAGRESTVAAPRMHLHAWRLEMPVNDFRAGRGRGDRPKPVRSEAERPCFALPPCIEAPEPWAEPVPARGARHDDES